LNYQWRKNTSNISGATTSALTLSSISLSDAATYDAVITNSAGTTNSAPATLMVATPPVITNQPPNQSVCQGSSVSLRVMASGSPLFYQWQFNGTNLSATLSSYTLSSVHTNKSGNYTVIVSNICGVVTSAAAAVTVVVPILIAVQPQSEVVTQSANATFCFTGL
jgi:hypothetical protein